MLALALRHTAVEHAGCRIVPVHHCGVILPVRLPCGLPQRGGGRNTRRVVSGTTSPERHQAEHDGQPRLEGQRLRRARHLEPQERMYPVVGLGNWLANQVLFRFVPKTRLATFGALRTKDEFTCRICPMLVHNPLRVQVS